jgi:hypothetical protein
MVKIKASEIELENEGIKNQFPELKMKGLIINASPGDSTLSSQSVKNNYLVIMTEAEYREKINSRSGKRHNPLMLNFEEYES